MEKNKSSISIAKIQDRKYFSMLLRASHVLIYRGVETVGPVSPVGHGHLRSDSSTVLSDQMSERTPEYLKCYLGDISACIGPTVKYNL